MQVAIVCISDTFFDRVRLLRKYYLSKGNTVTVVTSDFSHRQKEKIQDLDGADILLETPPYGRNLSVQRLISHHKFAKRAREEMERLSPDVIHVIVPANSLCKTMGQYKADHPEVKLYFDINDLWPEALPIRHFEWLPMFSVWRNLRDLYLDQADRVFVECSLFLKGLKVTDKFSVLHFARSQKPQPIKEVLDDKTLSLVYLGSINNIIDIELIRDIVNACTRHKPTTLHIIGEGENKQRLLDVLSRTDAKIVDHGELFDTKEKQEIFDHCHYGLNVMKPGVMVGLTMKSLDYMIGGVPILNSIGGDTEELTEDENLGWNVDRNNLQALADTICTESLADNYERRRNMQKVYNRYFSEDVFFQALEEAEV